MLLFPFFIPPLLLLFYSRGDDAPRHLQQNKFIYIFNPIVFDGIDFFLTGFFVPITLGTLRHVVVDNNFFRFNYFPTINASVCCYFHFLFHLFYYYFIVGGTMPLVIYNKINLFIFLIP